MNQKNDTSLSIPLPKPTVVVTVDGTPPLPPKLISVASPADPPFDARELFYWRIALKLRLRESNTNAFQDFFSTVMECLHGDDFVRVGAFGKIGDLGCDGYVVSSGEVFQCYGALAGELKQVATLTSKMAADFAKAKAKLGGIMTKWFMVHNIADGIPVPAVQMLKALEKENPEIEFGFIAPEGFWNRVKQLGRAQIESFLGPSATAADDINFDSEELKQLVQHICSGVGTVSNDLDDIRPVPVNKLTLNKLPDHWRFIVESGRRNAYLVGRYFGQHPDPYIGQRVADIFRNKYEALKVQNLSPDDVMTELYEKVTGIGNVPPKKQIAAQALLAFLFDNCDIFERDPTAAYA